MRRLGERTVREQRMNLGHDGGTFRSHRRQVAYEGAAEQFGTPGDSMVGSRIGGVNVFGGGLALYNARRKVVGALGVSGDTSCADHMSAGACGIV